MLISLANLQAETKEEIMNLLAERMKLEDPDTIIYSKKARDELDRFMRKHANLFNSLGKKEIFYHLELTYNLFDENRPGPQPHAVYAVHLYSRFHEDYTEEEKKLISERLKDFASKGWLGKKDLETILAAQSKADLRKPIAAVSNKILSVEPAEAPPISAKTVEVEEVTPPEPAIEKPVEDATAEPSEEPVEKSSNWLAWLPARWLWLIGLLVFIVGIAWMLRRK